MYDINNQHNKIVDVQNLAKTRDMIKSFNNVYTYNDNVSPKTDDNVHSTTNCRNLSTAYHHSVHASSIDVKKRSLVSPVKSNKINSSIILIATKLNQSDEKKKMHYNISSSSGVNNSHLNETNMKTTNSAQKSSEDVVYITTQKNGSSGFSEQKTTATILVSKSKTKTGLPLLLKKSK